MNESQESTVSEDTTSVLEKEKDSEVIVDQQQQTTKMESADPSASSEATTEAESENQLRCFVTLLTARVLTKSRALQNWSQEDRVSRTKHLINKTMEGLAVADGFCLDVKYTKKLCKAVTKDLSKMFCSGRLLESMILLQDPAVDAAIVHSLQAHIKELHARQAEKETSRISWKDALQVVTIAAGFLVALFLLALVP